MIRFLFVSFFSFYLNMNNKYNMNVLAEAKEEYTKQLISILTPEMYVGIKSIYDAAYEHCSKMNDKNVLKKFQLLLSNIPKWDSSKINNEYSRILDKTKCDWLEDLITAVFVSHTKVLSSIQIKNTNKSIKVNVPVGQLFLHKSYEQCARNFWKKSWLLDRDVSSINIQRNMIDSENLIKDSIEETIRKLLPVKQILKEYVGKDFQDEDTIETIEKSTLLPKNSNIRSTVKSELEKSLAENSDSDKYSSIQINGNDREIEESIPESTVEDSPDQQSIVEESIVESESLSPTEIPEEIIESTREESVVEPPPPPPTDIPAEVTEEVLEQTREESVVEPPPSPPIDVSEEIREEVVAQTREESVEQAREESVEQAREEPVEQAREEPVEQAIEESLVEPPLPPPKDVSNEDREEPVVEPSLHPPTDIPDEDREAVVAQTREESVVEPPPPPPTDIPTEVREEVVEQTREKSVVEPPPPPPTDVSVEVREEVVEEGREETVVEPPPPPPTDVSAEVREEVVEEGREETVVEPTREESVVEPTREESVTEITNETNVITEEKFVENEKDTGLKAETAPTEESNTKEEKIYSDITDYTSIDSIAKNIKQQVSEAELKELAIESNNDAIKDIKSEIEKKHNKNVDTHSEEFSFFDGAPDYY